MREIKIVNIWNWKKFNCDLDTIYKCLENDETIYNNSNTKMQIIYLTDKEIRELKMQYKLHNTDSVLFNYNRFKALIRKYKRMSAYLNNIKYDLRWEMY